MGLVFALACLTISVALTEASCEDGQSRLDLHLPLALTGLLLDLHLCFASAWVEEYIIFARIVCQYTNIFLFFLIKS